MRTALFLVAGCLLLGGAFLLGRLFAPNYPNAPSVTTAAFVATWLAISALNMWTGVARAGYPVSEELPIFALIFLLPAVLAGLLHWKVR